MGNEGSYTVVIRNNGKPPEKEITEGGGLTNLRHRIENSGGKMTVQSLPMFLWQSRYQNPGIRG